MCSKDQDGIKPWTLHSWTQFMSTPKRIVCIPPNIMQIVNYTCKIEIVYIAKLHLYVEKLLLFFQEQSNYENRMRLWDSFSIFNVLEWICLPFSVGSLDISVFRLTCSSLDLSRGISERNGLALAFRMHFQLFLHFCNYDYAIIRIWAFNKIWMNRVCTLWFVNDNDKKQHNSLNRPGTKDFY